MIHKIGSSPKRKENAERQSSLSLTFSHKWKIIHNKISTCSHQGSSAKAKWVLMRRKVIMVQIATITTKTFCNRMTRNSWFSIRAVMTISCQVGLRNAKDLIIVARKKVIAPLRASRKWYHPIYTKIPRCSELNKQRSKWRLNPVG